MIPVDPNPAKSDPDKPHVAGNAAQMGPVRPQLPVLYQPPIPWDAAALRREFYGPLETIPQPPAAAPVLRVSRGSVPGAGAFRSLAEALAALPDGAAIIEIQDCGPLFVGNLPALDGREVWLRGASGIRPLLAWEPPSALTKTKTPATLFTLRGGRLVVEGLDLAGKWTSDQAEVPTSVFHVAGGQLCLRNCTVSLAGAQRPGIALARLRRGADMPRLRISGCYARGIDLTALAVEDTSADVLIDESLLAGSAQPLVRLAGGDDDAVTLRIVHSTLVAAQNAVRIDRGTITLSAMLCDAILARNDPAAATGDLVRFAKDADPRLRWRAVNSVYAGWKQLLSSESKAIDGSDMNAWRGVLRLPRR